MRVLITGGAGHLGPIVCRAFAREGFDVRVLCHRKAIKNIGSRPDIVWGDITDPDSVKRALEGADAVVHMAGILSPLTEEKPELASRVNVGGTRTVVRLLREQGKGIPFVFTSSAVVFGPSPNAAERLSPHRTPCNPTSVYASTKLQAENLIRESGIEYLILRFTSVAYLDFRLSDMKRHMFTIPLGNRLEFCHPDDAALAILNAVKSFDEVKGKTLMIAGGASQQMHYEDLVRAALGTFGLPLPPRRKFPTGTFDLDWYDTAESQKLLRYQNKTLDDYSRDLAAQLPAPLVALMRRFIGPVFGRIIVRLM